MPRPHARSSARTDAMKQERDALAADIADAQAMLDRFEVGKQHWSLAGRIELLGEAKNQAKDLAVVLGLFIAELLESHGITLEDVAAGKYTAEQLRALLINPLI